MATSEVHSESDEDITDTDMLAEMRKLLKALKKADTKLVKYENEIIILQKFIDGYTIENNTGDHDKVIESATILGRIIKELQKYKKLQCV